MNAKNALGFLAFGAFMSLLPKVAPGWFPPDGVDGTSGRAIWMASMGLVQSALGSCYLARHFAIDPLRRWSETRATAEKPVSVMLPGAGRIDAL
jgi:hypothetical protein